MSEAPLSHKLLSRPSAAKVEGIPPQRSQPVQNRVRVLLVHIPRLSIRGQARLAAEVGVSRSTISRLVSGRVNPSYRLARGVTDALERLMGRPLDMREVFSTDGTYLTASGCALCRCKGCLPEEAFDADGNLKTQWQGVRPGDWSLARPADPPPFNLPAMSYAMDESWKGGQVSASRTAPTPMRDAGNTQISEQLRKRLLSLDYPDFARCVCRLLEALGYEDARPAGRDEWKGYNRPGGGGWDLEASLPGGLAPRRVVAQIKQFATLTVHQRSVDELRGACLRAGASEGLLVTTSVFSEVVRRAAMSPAPAATAIAPIRLIDGENLAALMVRHRIGVREA